jgi:hypothetical protein
MNRRIFTFNFMVVCVSLLSNVYTQAQSSLTELTKTNENHKLLAAITGTWSFAGKHTFTGSARVIKFTGSMTRTALWNGRYFISDVTGQDIPMPWSNGKPVTLHEMMTEGYDNVKGKFVSSYINNESETGIILLEGSYDADKKIITYDGETLSPPKKGLAPGAMRKFRVLLKFIDNDHYTLEWHESAGDKELFDTVLNFTRK